MFTNLSLGFHIKSFYNLIEILTKLILFTLFIIFIIYCVKIKI